MDYKVQEKVLARKNVQGKHGEECTFLFMAMFVGLMRNTNTKGKSCAR